MTTCAVCGCPRQAHRDYHGEESYCHGDCYRECPGFSEEANAMVIRDDRGTGFRKPPWTYRPPFFLHPRTDCDHVLIDCPACGRAHFVTVDGCPGAAEAAAEVGQVDGRKAA